MPESEGRLPATNATPGTTVIARCAIVLHYNYSRYAKKRNGGILYAAQSFSIVMESTNAILEVLIPMYAMNDRSRKAKDLL